MMDLFTPDTIKLEFCDYSDSADVYFMKWLLGAKHPARAFKEEVPLVI
jgi:hypothetical protein